MDATAPTSFGPHTGLGYDRFLARLSRAAAVQRYLEIGVARGTVFAQVACRHGIGVDPGFSLDANVAADKTRVSLHQVTSDVFFERLQLRRQLGGRIDLAFLDGMHLFEFLLRDVMNTEAISRRDSILCLHDCLPLAEPMAERDPMQAHARSQGTPYADWWTGDVWKVVPILAKYRPDLTVMPVDCAPTGLVVITGLDPSSRVLKKNYDAIVREFSQMPNDAAGIARMYAAHPLVPAEEALRRLGGRSYLHGRGGFLRRFFG